MMKKIRGYVALYAWLLLPAGCQGCNLFTPATAPAADNLGICILEGYAAGDSPGQIVASCGTDLQTVLNTLDALKKAEVKDGVDGGLK